MAANPSGQGFQNKNRVAILAELDKEKRKLLMQNQSSTNHPGAGVYKYQHFTLYTTSTPSLKNRDVCLEQPAHGPSLAASRSRGRLSARTSAITPSSSTSPRSRRQPCRTKGSSWWFSVTYIPTSPTKRWRFNHPASLPFLSSTSGFFPSSCLVEQGTLDL
nr:SOSS complex subunit C isoform X1 [Oryctolagus cuniculus]